MWTRSSALRRQSQCGAAAPPAGVKAGLPPGNHCPSGIKVQHASVIRCRRHGVCALRAVLRDTNSAVLERVAGPSQLRTQHSRPNDRRSSTRTSPPWLHQAIPQLVRQLSTEEGAHACLQLVREPSLGGLTFEYRHMDGPDVAPAEVWSQVSRNSSFDGPTAVILARPIPDPSKACPLSCSTLVQSAPSQTPNRPAMQHQARLRSPPSAQESSYTDLSHNKQGGFQGVAELEGLVDLDDCCGGTGTKHAEPASTQAVCRNHQVARTHSQHYQPGSPQPWAQIMVHATGSIADSSRASDAHPVTPRSRRRFLRRQQARASSHEDHSDGAGSRCHTSYYGLAVQTLRQSGVGQAQWGTAQPQWPHTSSSTMPGMSAVSESPDGCYVLKLSRNRDVTGCTCTVYSLTRICRGQPLYSQLQQSWIAS